MVHSTRRHPFVPKNFSPRHTEPRDMEYYSASCLQPRSISICSSQGLNVSTHRITLRYESNGNERRSLNDELID
jgi:hypothetical protein